jgi:hypothetical protein
MAVSNRVLRCGKEGQRRVSFACAEHKNLDSTFRMTGINDALLKSDLEQKGAKETSAKDNPQNKANSTV